MNMNVVNPRPAHGAVMKRIVAIIAAILLLGTATTLVNRVLPGWAYPVTGVVAVGVLLGLAC